MSNYTVPAATEKFSKEENTTFFRKDIFFLPAKKIIIYSREILKLYLPEGGVNHQGFGFTEPKAR